MTSFREVMRRLLRTDWQGIVEDSAFADVLHWTRIARGWDADRRMGVLRAARAAVQAPGFRATQVERLPEVDDADHA